MNQIVDKGAKAIAAIGAVNWLTSKLFSFDILSFLSNDMLNTGAVVLIGVSGGYVLYQLFQKKY